MAHHWKLIRGIRGGTRRVGGRIKEEGWKKEGKKRTTPPGGKKKFGENNRRDLDKKKKVKGAKGKAERKC